MKVTFTSVSPFAARGCGVSAIEKTMPGCDWLIAGCPGTSCAIVDLSVTDRDSVRPALSSYLRAARGSSPGSSSLMFEPEPGGVSAAAVSPPGGVAAPASIGIATPPPSPFTCTSVPWLKNPLTTKSLGIGSGAFGAVAAVFLGSSLQAATKTSRKKA